jgi:GNAT superfamily N-acetyltransferase
MTLKFITADLDDGAFLAEIRVRAMQPSLEAIGRFDPVRARTRFLERYSANQTQKIIVDDDVVGFFVVENRGDHLWLDHLYIDPKHQGLGFGARVLNYIKDLAQGNNLSVCLGALRGSQSNQFYQTHGFVKTTEEEWDIYYEWKGSAGSES